MVKVMGLNPGYLLKYFLLYCLGFIVGHFRDWSHSMAIVTLNKIDKYEHGIMVSYLDGRGTRY